MIYKILDVEPTQTSTGKPMKRLAIEGVDKKINIFSDFPHYADIIIGSTIDGEIRKNDKGYDNLYSNEIKSSPRGNFGSRTADITKAVETKAKNIAVAQENRSEGIKISGTWRDAVMLAIEAHKDPTRLNTLEEEILYWRKYAWTHYDDPNTNPLYPDN